MMWKKEINYLEKRIKKRKMPRKRPIKLSKKVRGPTKIFQCIVIK